MRLNIWNEVKKVLYNKWIILFLLIYCFYCGTNVQIVKNANLSSFEFILSQITDHYFIIYFLFITYFILLFNYMRLEDDTIIIRHRTKMRVLKKNFLTFFITAFIYVGIHFFISSVIGFIALPFSTRFIVIENKNIYNELVNLLIAFKMSFKSPIVAILVSYFYLVIGITTISTILWFINKRYGSSITMITFIVIIGNVFLGFKTGVDEIFFLVFLNKHLVFHHVFFYQGIIGVLLIILLEFLILIFVCKLYVNNKKIRKKERLGYMHLKLLTKKNFSITFLFLFLYYLLLTRAIILNEGMNIQESLVYIFKGFSPIQLNVKEFMEYILYFFFPLFVIGVFLEDINSYSNGYILLRYKKRKKYIEKVLSTTNMYTFYYIVFTTIILLVIFCLNYINYQPNSGSYIKEFLNYSGILKKDLYKYLGLSIVLKILEISWNVHMFILLQILLKNVAISYLIIIGSYLIILIPIVRKLFWIGGLSSLYRINEMVELYSNNLLLLVILIYGVLIYILRKTIIKIVEEREVWIK